MRNLLTGARSGQDRPAYASVQARDADIERGAASSAKDLIADLADSSMALRAIARELPDQAWQVRVRMLDSAPFPAAGLLTRRLVEVELHHCDLAAGYSPADWPPAFAAMELTEPMRSQRRDRLRYPPPSAEAEPAWPGRPPPPWKPGQRLPGSWLGTADESRPLATSPDPGATPVAMIVVTYRRRRTPARPRLRQPGAASPAAGHVLGRPGTSSPRESTACTCPPMSPTAGNSGCAPSPRPSPRPTAARKSSKSSGSATGSSSPRSAPSTSTWPSGPSMTPPGGDRG
jgi:hypothetical protein